jgi:hypothetical protein
LDQLLERLDDRLVERAAREDLCAQGPVDLDDLGRVEPGRPARRSTSLRMTAGIMPLAPPPSMLRMLKVSTRPFRSAAGGIEL